MKYKLFLIWLITLFTIIISGCNQEIEKNEEITTNDNIIQFKDFYVNSESTKMKTSVKGTIFLSGDEGNPKKAQIVASINVDPDDWGGVVFYVPSQWNISSITSSYPDVKNDKDPKDYVATWTTSDTKYDLNKMIEIGTNRYKQTVGGKGSVVIELDMNEEKMELSDSIKILVGVGSKEKDGIRSIHPDHELIEINIP